MSTSSQTAIITATAIMTLLNSAAIGYAFYKYKKIKLKMASTFGFLAGL